jgi:hypothetical protein
MYNFKYRTTAFDLWQLSMYGIYGSTLGVVNVIFTFAMIALTIKFWVVASLVIKILLILAMSLFVLIQPLVVYKRAKKQVANITSDTEISVDDRGVHVKVENQTSDLKWHSIKGITKKPNMVIILSTNKHGFILSNKVLGQQKKAFYDYVQLKLDNN